MISTIHPSRKLIQEPSVQEKLDKALFKKRSHEDWQQLILQWQHSGLSQKSFCEQHKINFHNFVYPRNKMRKDQSHQGSFASVYVRIGTIRTVLSFSSRHYKMKEY